MVFQEGALFDSLTVAENVGYKLYEETDMPLDEVRQPRRGSARVRRPGRVHRPACRRSCRAGSGGAWRLPARWRPSRASCSTTKPTTGLDPITATTVDEEIIKLRDLENVSSIVVTHQLRDAFLRGDARGGARGRHALSIVPADAQKCDEAEFIMLKEGRIAFEGHAAELRASTRSRTSGSVSVIEDRKQCRARVHWPGRN